MTQPEMFERVRARLRKIWEKEEWDQEAWRDACRDLWVILEGRPDFIDQMLDGQPGPPYSF